MVSYGFKVLLTWKDLIGQMLLMYILQEPGVYVLRASALNGQLLLYVYDHRLLLVSPFKFARILHSVSVWCVQVGERGVVTLLSEVNCVDSRWLSSVMPEHPNTYDVLNLKGQGKVICCLERVAEGGAYWS